jgi:hypothetical protein
VVSSRLIGPISRDEMAPAQEGEVEVTIKAQETALKATRIIGSREALCQAGFSLTGPGQREKKKATTSFNCVAIVNRLPRMVEKTFSSSEAEASGDENGEEDHDEAVGKDVIYLVFPPSVSPDAADADPKRGNAEVSRVLFMGSGTGSCPDGQCELSPQCFSSLVSYLSAKRWIRHRLR